AGDGLGQAGGLGDGATAGGEAASRVDLELDVEDGAVLAEVERLGERRDARAAMRRTEPGAGVEPPQRVERLSGDVAAAAGGAIEGRVVQQDRNAVGAEPHVEFDPVGSLVERQLESRK